MENGTVLDHSAESELSGLKRIASSLVMMMSVIYPSMFHLKCLFSNYVFRDYNMAEDAHLHLFTLDNWIESEICERIAKLRLGPHVSELLICG